MGTRNFNEPKNADALYIIDYGIDYDDEGYDEDYFDDYYYREIEKGLLQLFMEKMQESYKKTRAKIQAGKNYDGDFYIYHDGVELRPRIQYGYYDGAYIDFDIFYNDEELENDDDDYYYNDYYGDAVRLPYGKKKKLSALMKRANDILFEITHPMICIGTFSNGEGVYENLK